ncbi:HD domain-containing protein [Halanaerobium saccharolyticum]|uniref:HD domain-containing protein n=1 Tax=Halanaerobium saccharolyticum TaxID=43595 RepID=A0A4R6LVB2_9FIRM|nr:HD domain-containing phosphohydrolase [Halanaerobium saccharolyticum]TDO91270.1 HD domain-containing protein [Halanaerobium saccharolyticum]
MQFNLKQFLISISFVLDYIEIDILDDITNHSKRVAYIALKLGEMFNLTEKEQFSLLAFSIMHDIGGVENKKGVSKSELEKAKSHCVIGEKTINKFPLISEYENIILYHHENVDGSGFFNKKGNEIPLFSQIISLADFFELNYDGDPDRSVLVSQVSEQIDIRFSKRMINAFRQIIKQENFWLNLEDIFILDAVKEESGVCQESCRI